MGRDRVVEHISSTSYVYTIYSPSYFTDEVLRVGSLGFLRLILISEGMGTNIRLERICFDIWLGTLC